MDTSSKKHTSKYSICKNTIAQKVQDAKRRINEQGKYWDNYDNEDDDDNSTENQTTDDHDRMDCNYGSENDNEYTSDNGDEEDEENDDTDGLQPRV